MSELNQHPLIVAYREANRFGKFMGMEFSINKPGAVTYTLKVTHDHLATSYAGHGGVIAALADALLGVGALSMVCQEDKVVATLDLGIRFLEPVFPGDSITGHSTAIKSGKRIIFMEGELYNQNGTLIARCNGTFNAYPSERAGY